MIEFVWPALFAVIVWWASTGIILWLDALPTHTFRWSMLAATGMLVLALYGLAVSSTDTTPAGAYEAFSYAIMIWGWQEMAFLMGFITGTRRTSCAPNCGGFAHFRHAVEAIIHHELTLIVLAALVVVLTLGGPNQTGTWTFLILWALRQSAKLNLFFGVPNLNKEFLPEHLRYLDSFLTKRPMNLLFPVSITASTIGLVLLVQAAASPSASSAEATAYTLISALLALAILEHWFMVLPLPSEALWSWARPSQKPVEPAMAFDKTSKPPARDHRLQSWSAPLADTCDVKELHDVLEATARGAYGDVWKVEGIARAGAGWIRFAVAGGRATVAAFVPRDFDRPNVEAFGCRLEPDKLEAAFAACRGQVAG